MNMLHSGYNYKQFLRLRLWLKIGLVQEKQGAYDSAATSYLEAIKLADEYFLRVKNDNTDLSLNSEKLSHLKLFYQPHFCLAYLQEKMSSNAHGNTHYLENFINTLNINNIIQMQSSTRDSNPELTNLPFLYSDCLNKAGSFFYLKGFGPANSREDETLFLKIAIDKYFKLAINVILQHYFSIESPNFFNNILRVLFEFNDLKSVNKKLFDKTQPADIYGLLALTLSNLGDAFLSQMEHEPEDSAIQITRLSLFLNTWNELPKKAFKDTSAKKLTEVEDENCLLRVIFCYLTAGKFFLLSAMHKECAFEYEKILRTLQYCEKQRKCFGQHEIEQIPELIKNIKDYIFEPAADHYRIAYLNVHRSLPAAAKGGDNNPKEPLEVNSLKLHWLSLQDDFCKLALRKNIKENQQEISDIEKPGFTPILMQGPPANHIDSTGRNIDLPNSRNIQPQSNFNTYDVQIENLRHGHSKSHNETHAVQNQDYTKMIEEIRKYINEITQDDHFDNVMERIYRLSFKTKKLADYFRSMLGINPNAKDSQDFFDIEKEDEKFKEFLEGKNSSRAETAQSSQANIELAIKYIKDGLFCSYHSIILRELHSNTFWWLHLGRAFMHKLLADWARRYERLLELLADPDIISRNRGFEEDLKKQKKEIEQYVDIKNMKYVDYVYQLQQALENFHQVKETHTSGRAYKSLIQRMYYLNDDFNDRVYLFYLAQERFALRRGMVNKCIIQVEELIEKEYRRKMRRSGALTPQTAD